jgi:hypothetical protein
VVFGQAVKVVKHAGLIGAPNVIQVIEEEVRISIGKVAQFVKKTLKVENVSMEEISLRSFELPLHLLLLRA